MFCIKCGNELRENDLFCSKCGNKINYINNDTNNEKTVETQESNVIENKEFTEAKKKEKLKKIFNALWINGLTGLIVYFGFMTFWYLVNGEFYIPLFLKIVIIGCCVLNFIKLIVLEEYSGECPYCKSDLKILGDSANCPKCNRRIIVKNNKFYKI